MRSTTSFKRVILRAVLRDVYPMVIRLVAVPDCLELADFDDIFHALLGWDSGIGYAFQVHGQEFNSFRRDTRYCAIFDFIGKRSFYTRWARWTSGSGNCASSTYKREPMATKLQCAWVVAERRLRSTVAARPDIG